MAMNVTRLAVMVGLLGGTSVAVADQPIDIHTDLEGQYYLVEQGGSPGRPVLLVKRIAPGITHYVKREIDCGARTVRYLGEGESLDEIANAEPDPEVQPVEKGSIADQLRRLVCPDD